RGQERIGKNFRARSPSQKCLHARGIDHLRIAAKINSPAAQIRVVLQCEFERCSGAMSLTRRAFGDALSVLKIRMGGGNLAQLFGQVEAAGLATAMVQANSPTMSAVQRIARDAVQWRQTTAGSEQ